METAIDFSKPEAVLCAFWMEMNAWELGAAQSLPRNRSPEMWEQWLEQTKTAWKPIFARYCTPKPRVYGENRTVGTPFYYDPKTEIILETTYTSPRRVIIKTQRTQKVKKQTMVTGEYCYVLFKRSEGWLIDNRYFYSLDKIVRGTL